jgi:hypothetical protein
MLFTSVDRVASLFAAGLDPWRCVELTNEPEEVGLQDAFLDSQLGAGRRRAIR